MKLMIFDNFALLSMLGHHLMDLAITSEGALIASHPRNIASVRRESTTRKEARERKKERKEAEKRDLLAVRKEEIRRERKAIQQRVSRLREGDELTGDDHEESSRKEEENAEVARLRNLKAKELGRKLERVTAEGGLSAISQEGTFPPNHGDIFFESLMHTFHSTCQS